MNARQFGWLGLVLAGGMLTIGGTLSADDPKPVGPAEPVLNSKPFKPVQDVERVMESQDELFKEIKDAILEKEWRDGESAAWMLAEMANVNQYHSKEAKYQELAGKMVGQCVDLAKTLRKRKGDEAKEQVTQLSQTCKSCHDQYKKQW